MFYQDLLFQELFFFLLIASVKFLIHVFLHLLKVDMKWNFCFVNACMHVIGLIVNDFDLVIRLGDMAKKLSQ